MQETSALNAFFNMILYFIAFLFVIFLVYFFTKIIAKKTSNYTKGNKIKIIDFLSLGTNSKILIVEIIDNIYILAANNNQISVIDKLNKGNIDTSKYTSNEANEGLNLHFDEILKNTKKLKYKFTSYKLRDSKNQVDTSNNISFKDSKEDKE